MMLEGQNQKWWFVLHICHSADMMINIWMMNSFRFLGFGIRDLLHVCFFPSQFPKLHYWLCHGVDGVLGKLMVRVRFVSKLGVRPRMASFLFHFLFLKGNRSRNKIWCQILEVQSISTPNFKLISDFRGTIFCQWCSSDGGDEIRPHWHQWRSHPSRDLAPRIGEINSKMPCPKPPNTSPVLKTHKLQLSDENETLIYMYIWLYIHIITMYKSNKMCICNGTVVLSNLVDMINIPMKNRV